MYSRRDRFLAEYVTLQGEVRARREDQLAVIRYQPPEWVIEAPGEQPAEPHRRAVWYTIVRFVAATALSRRYHTKLAAS